MDRVPDISAKAALPPQGEPSDRDLSQNATRVRPSTGPKRPVRHRLLLADRIDRQFPLIRSI